MMLTLIKKDLGLNRVAILGNLILIVAAYVVISIVIVSDISKFDYRDVIDAYAGATFAGMGITCLLASVYGGIAFAQERRETSANFLAMLPVNRKSIILSKLIAGILCLFAMLFAGALALFVLYICGEPTGDWNLRNVEELLPNVLITASTTVMLFGVGWMCSSFLKSPPMAACISIASMFATVLLIQLMLNMGNKHISEAVLTYRVYVLHTLVPLLVGLATFTIGTAYYLKRVEP
jgi:ABC-type transport system involved in multi-copper enzyme maturation permease subunit